MYVFGHHDIRHCKLAFGRYDGNRVEVQWEGICDVFWDDEFSENVPFICRAFAETK